MYYIPSDLLTWLPLLLFRFLAFPEGSRYRDNPYSPLAILSLSLSLPSANSFKCTTVRQGPSYGEP